MAEFPVSLLNDPAIVSQAAKANMTPEQYLKSMRQNNMDPNNAPVLNSLEASPTALERPAVLEAPSVTNIDGAMMNVRAEQGILNDSLSERGNLERQIARLAPAVDTQADIDRLEMMRIKLSELGGPTADSPNSAQYDDAASAYLDELRSQQEIAASNNPEVRAANAELETTGALLEAGGLTPELQTSIQSRYDAANTALGGALNTQANSVEAASNAQLSLTNPVNGRVMTSGPEQDFAALEAQSSSAPAPVLNEPPEGFHQMPDGSMMADAEMSGGYDEVPMPPPVLESPEIRNGLTPNPSALPGAADPYAPPVGPVLEDPAAPAAKANGVLATTPTAVSGGALSSTATSLGSGPQRPTGNARGSSMAYGKIGIGEQMMRAGLKGLGASDQGMSASLGAMGQSYGETQDANRATLIAKAKADEATRIANARQSAINAKNAAAAAKGAKGMPSAQSLMYGKAALSAIERTENLVASEQSWAPWDNTTGIFGNLMKNIPSSAANDVMANIKTIEAAVGFDRLQAMRDASPTGGALGQVSNIELDLLKSSLANLNQAQSKEQFLTNLAQVKEVYNDIVNGGAGAPAASNGGYTIKMKE